MVQDTTVDGDCGTSYPLSPMQQGFMFHRLEGGAPGVDVEQVVAELHHPLHLPEFDLAWRYMVQRHEALRLSFVGGAAEPRQRVEAPDDVALPLRVLEFGTVADAEEAVETYLGDDRRLGFAALAAPLARVAVFRVGEERAWFVFTYHHLVLDARGMFALFREVLEVHDAFVRGEPVNLTPARPYRDYLAWLETLDPHRAEEYWREQLRGFAGAAELPLSAPAPDSGAGDAPGELACRFSAAETAALRAAARRHGVTLNTLLQGAWALVLSRYSGEEDVVFGAVRACRHVPVEGAADMVGLLINTVPVRVRLAGAASVGHWLRDLREQWLALRDYEHTPLVRVQRWSELPPGRRLFDTLFNFQEPSWIGSLRRLGGAWAGRHFDIRSQPNYPLALDLYADDELLVRAFHDRRRFAADAVAGLLGHFRAAVRALAADRVDTLGALSILEPRERVLLLRDWNATAADYPRTTCVHEQFEGVAAGAPDRLAVADPRTSLTYGELNRRANRLAHRLRAAGIGPEKAVAVAMDRSAAMLVAWLGVLKAGGAFVPLDPASPAERLAFQLADCGATCVLTAAGATALPPLPGGVTRLELAADGGGFAGEPDDNVRGGATSGNLAYVIYTSGSTGRPKGVEIEHRSLLNLVTWHQRTYSIVPDDRAPQVASPAFDAAVWEVWPYLTAGASIHVPDEETRIAPERLWAWLAAERITVAFLPTPLAEAALQHPRPAGLSLRALLTGGDRLRHGAPANLGAVFVNHYGPTENTVVATAGVAGPGPGAPSIGRPIANTTAFVLDRDFRPVPAGVPGELCLGGESLARGYHGRPDLSVERFVAEGECRLLRAELAAAGLEPGPLRLYRTGDLVRWTAAGELEYLGRRDHQVKIRGCRIELGEIEAVLQRHPAVREAVVVARPGPGGASELTGYIVARGGASAAEGELVEFLRRMLPSYMVPAGIVALPAWPLTANGKIDRAALPAPAAAAAGAPAAVPATGQEQTVAAVWAEVLGRGPLGRDDDFFALGGHSLLAAQAVTRLNALLGTAVSVRTLFDHSTVAAFARELEARGPAALPRPPALRPKRRPAAPELELVPPR